MAAAGLKPGWTTEDCTLWHRGARYRLQTWQEFLESWAEVREAGLGDLRSRFGPDYVPFAELALEAAERGLDLDAWYAQLVEDQADDDDDDLDSGA